jgi:hypothetical protein
LRRLVQKYFCGVTIDTHDVILSKLLRPEVERHAPWWSYLGAVCGGGVGFIVANVPGLMLGAYAGNRLGAVRDAKGKSVASVFSELGGTQKAEVSRHYDVLLSIVMSLSRYYVH